MNKKNILRSLAVIPVCLIGYYSAIGCIQAWNYSTTKAADWLINYKFSKQIINVDMKKGEFVKKEVQDLTQKELVEALYLATRDADNCREAVSTAMELVK